MIAKIYTFSGTTNHTMPSKKGKSIKTIQLNIDYHSPSEFDRRRIEKIIDSRVSHLEIDDITYQHSVLCQTCLPYRNPGDDIRTWEHRQGQVALFIEAGNAYHPQQDEYLPLGLPFGPKARIILMHLNQLAIKTQKPVIDMERSLTAFIKRLGLDTGGKTTNVVKEQIRRLAASHMSITLTATRGTPTIKTPIIDAYDVWLPTNENNRVLWSSVIRLGEKYFDSLLEHAVPLDERHIAILCNNAMALDIYAWLTQRLHRINPHKPQFVAWQNLKEQFGSNYSDMYKFKQVFRKTIQRVVDCYDTAKVQEDVNKGFIFRYSPPPIPAKLITIK